MKSVRTNLLIHMTDVFKVFLWHAGLHDVVVGYYDDNGQRRICYLYNEKSDEMVAILTHILLKYGNLQNAYKQFTNELYSANVASSFNWTP